MIVSWGLHEELEHQALLPEVGKAVDKFVVKTISGAELDALVARVPVGQRDLVASKAYRVSATIAAGDSLDTYARKLMEPFDGTIPLRLIEAPVADDEIAGSVAVGFFLSGAIRTIGTVTSHTRMLANVKIYNLWSLIDPFDAAQEFRTDVNIEIHLHMLLLLSR